MRICLVTPHVPPTKCGVGDYTWRLASELSKQCEVVVITGRDQSVRPDANFRVMAEVPGWGPHGMLHLWRLVRRLQPAWVSIQYVPFLYERRGLTIALALTAAALRVSGVRIVLHVHEPFVPLDSATRVAVGIVQRLAFALLLASSRKVAVTISPWTSRFRRWLFWRPADVFWLPVGSGIPPQRCDDVERARLRQQLGAGPTDVVLAVVNPLGGGKIGRFVVDAWRRVSGDRRVAALLVIGTERADFFRRVDLPRPEAVRCTGYVGAEALSRWLTSSDLVLSPFVDGISSRRTSALCALEHGVPVVTTRGHLTDPDLFDASPAILTGVGNSDEFCEAVAKLIDAPDLRADLGTRGRHFFAEHFDADRLAARLRAELGS